MQKLKEERWRGEDLEVWLLDLLQRVGKVVSIPKLGIALKEFRESRPWNTLILKATLLPESRMSELLDEANGLPDGYFGFWLRLDRRRFHVSPRRRRRRGET